MVFVRSLSTCSLFFLFAGCCCKGPGRGEVERDPKLPKSLAVSWHGKPLPSKKGSHTSEADAAFDDDGFFGKRGFKFQSLPGIAIRLMNCVWE